MYLAILSRIHQFLWRSSLSLSNFVCGAFLYPCFYYYCFEFISFRNPKFPILLSCLFGFISVGIQSKGLSHNIIVHPEFFFSSPHYCSRYCSRQCSRYCSRHCSRYCSRVLFTVLFIFFYFILF